MDLNIATVIIQLFNFSIFVIVITKFLYRPLVAMLNERRAQIEKNMEEAEQAKADAKGLKEDYEARMREARKEAQDVIKNAVTSGEAMKEEIINDARKEAQRQKDRATAEITLERERIEKELQSQVATLSVAVAERILKETIDSESQKKLMAEFVRKVESGYGA